MARPTKLNPEVQDWVVKAIRAGNYAEAAVRAAGIGPSTYYRWLARGEVEAEGIYREFRDEVRRAEGEAEVHAVAILRRAMGSDWRAALAYLERRHPGGWRRRETRELTGPDGGPIRAAHSFDLTKLNDQELRLLEEMKDRAASSDD